jgi:non-ribosomal peptide synthetase-like protein
VHREIAGAHFAGGCPADLERKEMGGSMTTEKTAEVSAAGTAPSAISQSFQVASKNNVEQALAEALAEILSVDSVSVDDHFFDDLGADSMVMARFCARVRKRPELPSVSMKDIYATPTIRRLAAALGESEPSPVEPSPPETDDTPGAGGKFAYILCGTLQFLLFVAYMSLTSFITARSYDWVSADVGIVREYLRSVVVGGVLLLTTTILPIIMKWVLIGRWKQQEIRVWSLAYVRFWFVKSLIRANPLVLVSIGSPLYVLYLRALGAKVGKNVAIFSRSVPVCTDLLTIGEGTVIRKEAVFPGYRAHAGRIQTGTVTIGKNAFVGEKTVLDIGSSLGDGSQIGHASSLHSGQAVPDGEHWHGSPAQPADVDYQVVEPARCGLLRKISYTTWQLVTLLIVWVPLGFAGVNIILTGIPKIGENFSQELVYPTGWAFWREVLVLSTVLYFGAAIFGIVFVYTVPRLLRYAIKPGAIYPLYGIRYSIHRTIARITNLKFYMYLFGDSSYIVHYLQGLGFKLSRAEQTGSNFGMTVVHESPYLTTVGRGTMVADGLSVINADYSNTSFRASPTSIGPHNFLGNNIAYPSQGRTGANCLLATKVMVPIDGKIREGVGLLGSPSFEIPRTVERDSRFDHMAKGEEFRRNLRMKNRYNLRTVGVVLLARWVYIFVLTLLAMAAAGNYQMFGAEAVAVQLVIVLLFSLVYFVLLERGVAGFRRLRPQLCSIYDPYFWWHERYWKLVLPQIDRMLAGTPFKNIVSRVLGVRMGKRVFDDGCFMTERTLTAIGDGCTLNAGSVLQCHSQEDGTFKSDHITIGAGCTLGVGAFVHYGVTMGDGSVLGPDAFLMKGEDVPEGAHWAGNPAREMRMSCSVSLPSLQ